MSRLSLLVLLLSSTAWALPDFRAEKVRVAEDKKSHSYVKDGLIVGGDRAIDQVIVKDIRRAANAGYERIVIDLQGNKNGEPAAIERPPYFQVSVTPDERRMVLTLWGKPKLDFDSRKVISAFKKSAVVQNLVLLPRIETETWTFAMEMKSDPPVEVFELKDPVRIIIDIRTQKKR